jgi:hypothetical protein
MVDPLRALLECQAVLETLGDPRAAQCHTAAQRIGRRAVQQHGDDGEAQRMVRGATALQTDYTRGFVVQ